MLDAGALEASVGLFCLFQCVVVGAGEEYVAVGFDQAQHSRLIVAPIFGAAVEYRAFEDVREFDSNHTGNSSAARETA